MPHSNEFSIPKSPHHWDSTSPSSDSPANESSGTDNLNIPDDQPHFISSDELYDFIGDLNLLKEKSKLLTSRLKEWNLLHSDIRITAFRNRNATVSSFFCSINQICDCLDIPGLFSFLRLNTGPVNGNFLLARISAAQSSSSSQWY